MAKSLAYYLKDEKAREFDIYDRWAGFEPAGPQVWFVKDEGQVQSLLHKQRDIKEDLCRQVRLIFDEYVYRWDDLEKQLEMLCNPAYEEHDKQTDSTIRLVEEFAQAIVEDNAAKIIGQILPLLNDAEQIEIVPKGQFNHANIECVYILFGPNGILYIGQTQNMRKRMYAHRKDTLYGLSWLGAICVHTKRKTKLEPILIRKLDPPLNTAHRIPNGQFSLLEDDNALD